MNDYIFHSTTTDPDTARRWLDDGYGYMSQPTKDAVLDAIENHAVQLGHPNVYVGLTISYAGDGEMPSETSEACERIMRMNQQDWQKYHTPTEHGVPYPLLSHKELLEVAKRPVFDNVFQREYFTSDEADWDVTRTFVDARDDLTDWEWGCVSRRVSHRNLLDAKPADDLRRWLDTKHIGEQAIWNMGVCDRFYEAFAHLSVDTIMEQLKHGDPIRYTDAWIAATRNVRKRIGEIKTTGDVRTLGFALGMSGQPYGLKQLEAILSGETQSPVHYTGDWLRRPDVESRGFVIGFLSTDREQVNETTLLATLQLLDTHTLMAGDIKEMYNILAHLPEARASEKIQHWLKR